MSKLVNLAISNDWPKFELYNQVNTIYCEQITIHILNKIPSDNVNCFIVFIKKSLTEQTRSEWTLYQYHTDVNKTSLELYFIGEAIEMSS